MLGLFGNRYFRRVFICYFLVIACLLFSFVGYVAASTRQRENEMQQTSLENEARILARVVDERFGILSDTCVQLLGDSWITKASSPSEIISSTLNIYDRRSICEMVRHYMHMSGIASGLGVLLPLRGEVIDGTSFWDSEERFFQHIGISDPDFKDRLYEAVGQSYGGLVLLPIEYSKDIAVGRCLDAFTAPKQVFFFRISQVYFYNLLNDHIRADAFQVEILLDESPMLQARKGSEDALLRHMTVSSALFGWSYRISLPAAENAPFPLWMALVMITIPLLLALTSGLVISYFTYQPVTQLLGRLGLLHSSGDEFSAVSRRFEEIRQSEIRMEGIISQYYNSARNNLLLSLLHGSFARHVNNDTMELFGLPFDQDDRWLYMVMTVTGDGENQEEETARDLLNLQNYLTQQHLPAVNCVGPEDELILIFYSDDCDRMNAIRRLSRLEHQFREYCSETFENYACFRGSPHHGLLGISKSYQEALEDRTQAETGSYTEYYFPLDWEIQLITQLRAGNADVLNRLLRELSRENIARDLPVSEHRQLMSILAEIMLRVARETRMDTADFTVRLSAIVEMVDREAAWEAMNRLAQELCPVQEEIEGAQTVGERIRQHLHENFRDSNLSQKSIADKFGLTCPNMSRMFKRTTGRNFIDYLQELRVKAAREAFDAGRTDVLGVAKECGYENEVTFRRAFFRVFAISPHQYVIQRGNDDSTDSE